MDLRKQLQEELHTNLKENQLEQQNKVVLCYDRTTGAPIELYEEDRFLHTMVFGPSGTGKSSQVFLPLIYQDITNEDCGVVILDPKEDLAEEAYKLASAYSPRKVVYIDPISPGCPKVNPFSGTTDEIINTLSKIFTSGVTHNHSEQMAVNSTRILISRSIKLIEAFPALVSNSLNIKTYADFINNKQNAARMEIVKIKEKLSRENRSPELQEICEWFIKTYFEPSSKINEMCYDFRQKMEEIASNEFLSRVLLPTGYDAEILDFNKSLARGDVVIINARYSYLGHMAKTFAEFLLRLYMTAVFRRCHYQDEHHIGKFLKPNFIYIDEFATLSLMSTDLFVQGRSFRVGVHICIQSRALLRVCGDQDSTEQATIVEANTRNLILFPGMEGSDADYYSKQFFNLTPQQILYRPFGQIVYRIVQKRNIMPPNIGLVFFVDETPHTRSIQHEYLFDENGNIITNEFQSQEDWDDSERTSLMESDYLPLPPPIEDMVEDVIKEETDKEIEALKEEGGVFDEESTVDFSEETFEPQEGSTPQAENKESEIDEEEKKRIEELSNFANGFKRKRFD